MKVVEQLTRRKAHDITIQTHSSGKATVLVCWKDLAEKYCKGLQGQGLTASIAPDVGFKKKGGNNGEGGDGGGEGGGGGGDDGPSTA